MQIKTVKFDIAGSMAAMLLNQFHKPSFEGAFLYMVSGSETMYDVDGISNETFNVALGYEQVKGVTDASRQTNRDLYDLDSPTWVQYNFHDLADNEFHFTELPIGEVRHYWPAALVGVCWSPLNSPDEGFVVTELYPGDIDLTKDGVIKRRPVGMSETDAHKHIGKLPGRIEFTQALTILHRLNYIQQLANITAAADDDEGEE